MGQWEQGDRPYPYPFPLGGDQLPERARPEFWLPDSRQALGGTEDIGTQEWERRGRKLNSRRRFDTLEQNPDRGNRRRWRMFDSFGRPLCFIEKHDDHWAMSDEAGDELYRDRSKGWDQLELQGRGCMAEEALESTHALVAFRAHDRAKLGGASLMPYQLRAFIPRPALPVQNARGQAIRGAVDDYSVGCGIAPPGSEPASGSARPLGDPGFDSNEEKFLGTDGIDRTYATYNAKSPYAGAIYFLANTTGVRGGGIVRGVARPDDMFTPLDEFPYADPNVFHGEPVARWRYGQIGEANMWGWVPHRLRA